MFFFSIFTLLFASERIGSWVCWMLRIWKVFANNIIKNVGDYFLELFSSFCLSSVQFENVLSYLQPKVTAEMNMNLVVELIIDEVKCALM